MSQASPDGSWAAVRRILPAFFVGFVFAAIVAARSTIAFPYVRTLIACDVPSPANIDRTSSDWSGSAACGNVDTVVSRATLIRGYGRGADAAVVVFPPPGRRS